MKNLFYFFVLVANILVAQPTITSFTPTNGAIGASVTITGTNFNATAANNIVWFGKVYATVAAATATSLTVTVPVGTAAEPITVLNTTTSLMAQSTKPFIVTFSGGAITSSSMSAKVDFATGTNPLRVAFGDLDGDGKLDMVVANWTSNTISVYRNTSTSGSLATSSFATKVDFSTGSGVADISIGDFDGDGKLDVAVVNQSSNTISIFRNTSISGNITSSSFDAKVDFVSGNSPLFISSGDLDGDGKLDIAIANNASNTISVFRNTSTSGNITTSSFAAKVDFVAGTEPYGISLGDLDVDGKLDISVLNGLSHTISVYHNTSTSGSLTTSSFAAKVDFATGTNPNGLSIRDLDGDGKLDLAVANWVSNTISVYHNTSTSSSLTTSSFAAKVDFATGTNPNGLSIGDLDGDGKLDMAVANWASNTISVYRNTSISGNLTTSSFATKVDYSAGSGAKDISIGDLDGDGKLDIGVTNQNSNTISVLRNLNPPPTITSFTPTSGATGATVTITGTNFTGATSVSFGGTAATSFTVVSATSITAVVASGTTGTISVTAPGGTVTSSESFTYIPVPTITSFTPTSGAIGATVTITGTNFNTTAANNIVWFGKIKTIVATATATQLTVTVPVGTSAEPITVLNTQTGLLSQSAKPYIVTFTGGAITSSTMSAKVDFATGGNPNDISVGDLDGDGMLDLVATNRLSNTVSVYRNISTNNSLTTSSFASKVDLASGSEPIDISLGDLDGDGKLDIVVTNHASNNISVYRNTSTNGSLTTSSFAAKVDFTTGSKPTGISIDDIDGDGKLDISITNFFSNTISVFRNISTSGSLTTSSFATKVDFVTGTEPVFISLGDLDNDGKIDIAVTNRSSHTLSVFRNTSTSGNLTTNSFAAKVDFATGSNPYGFSIGDIDGDGKNDIVVTNNSSNNISVYRNTSTSGSFTISSFASKVDFTTGNIPRNISLGDIDGDGKLDLAVANLGSNTISVYRNTASSGSLSSNSFAANVDFVTGGDPLGISLGDINGDGKLDLVVANELSSSISVLRNLNPLPPTITSFSPTNGAIGATVTITGTNFNTTVTNNIVWFGKVKTTVATATATQLTVTVPVGTSAEPITVLNTQTSLLVQSAKPFIVTFTGGATTSSSMSAKVDFAAGNGLQGISLGDLDGDGKLDMAVANANSNTISVYQNTSTSGSLTTSSFGSKVDFVTGNNPGGISIDDVDGDGKLDMAVANWNSNTISVYRNTSTSGSLTTSSFAAKVDFATGSNPSDISIGDLDGDGKLDIAVNNYSSNTISIFRNTSINGGITISSFATKVDFATGSNPHGISIGDLDGDGKLDIVATNHYSNTISIYLNTSTSGSLTTSSFAAKVDFATGSNPFRISVGDVDGDSKLDIAISNEGSNTISVYRNTSTSGSLTTSSFAAKVDFATGSNPSDISIGDLDGDSKLDIVVNNYNSNTISIYRNNSTSGSLTTNSFASKIDFTTGNLPVGVSLGDLDGDGKLDLAVTNYTSNTISVLRNLNPLPPTITSFSPTNGAIGATVTITGTNFNTTVTNNIVWFGKVKSIVTAATATQLTVTVPVGAVAEPITVLNTETSLLAQSTKPFIVTFTGGAINSASMSEKVDFITGNNPVVISCGDLDGDGKLDMVIANTASNTVSVYRNISTSGNLATNSFTAKVDFATGSNPWAVLLEDLDGDGKLDIVVTNRTSNTISIFRNTSTSGSLTTNSFAAKVDFTTGSNPYGISIGDLDKDGKLDMAVTHYNSNVISIFRNTSTSGSLTTNSFTAKVDFEAGGTQRGIRLGDLDGDGKLDIAVTNLVSNIISVYRNTSSSGSITTNSFATKVDFATGNNPLFISLGDIDGDGKLDMAVTNYYSNTISLYRNTSTSGSITTNSFTTKVDFVTGSEACIILLEDLDGDGKLDIAVTNYASNTISVYRNSSTSGSLTTNSFIDKVDFVTGNNPGGISISDLDGDGKLDIAVANYSSNTISIYRNLGYPPPTITSFTPTTGATGTTVTITGTNFTGATSVSFGGTAAKSFTVVSAISITAVVESGTSGSVSVTTPGGTVTSSGSFTFILVPTITSFTPTSAAAGATVTITGTNFTGATAVSFGGTAATSFTVVSATSITAVVGSGTSGSVSVTTPGGTATSVSSGVNKSLKFTANNYVRIPKNSKIQNLNSITIEFWYRQESGSDEQIFGTEYFGDGWFIMNDWGKVQATMNGTLTGITRGGNWNTPTVVINNNQWYHYALAYDPSLSTNKFKFFIDGVLTYTGNDNVGLIGPNNRDIVINRHTWDGGSSSRLNGRIDEIRISNTARYSSNFTSPTTGFSTDQNTLALYHCDVENGTTFTDASGNNINGNFVGTLTYDNETPVTTPGGFTFIQAPTITSFTPTSAATGATVTITGTNFTGTTSVSFGGTAPTSFTVISATSISAVVASGTTGTISVTTPGGTATSTFTFTYIPPTPTITSFTPTIGATGTSVTITGTNFNTTAANNIVWFGKVKATVTNAVATSLTVTVPVGTSAEPITVLNSQTSLLTQSAKPFIVTFPNGEISSTSLSVKIDFERSTSPIGISIGDLDNDGKLDLAFTNGGLQTISVFRNTSSSGSLTTSSFSSKVDFASGSNPYGISLGDLDGDGKLDIAVANGVSNTISIYRNTSTSGNLTTSSFAAKVDFTTGSSPFRISLGDLDGDGKLDITVTNELSNTISVFRNTSTSGSITTSSFTAKVDFATGDMPRGIAIEDLDGDGKLDIAVTNGISKTISIFRNTSSSGSITTSSFTSKIDFTTGSFPRGISIGDLDGDDKLDMVVTNEGSNTLSIYRNTSTSGSLTTNSFAEKVDFVTGNNPYGISLGDLDGDSKLDLTVTNLYSATLSAYRNTSTNGNISTSSFASKIDFTTGSNPYGISLGDLDGDGRIDIAVTNGSSLTLSIYRNLGLIPPIAPVIINPVANAVNVPIQDTLKWRSVSRAISYKLQVSLLRDFTTQVKDTTTSDTTKYIFGMQNNKKYYWRVSGTNSSGDGPWSTDSFTTVKVKYLVSASKTGNGTISPIGDTLITEGDSIQYVVQANLGYQIDSLVMDNNVWKTRNSQRTIHTFINVTSNHKIHAYFGVAKLLIVSNSGPNGTITPLGEKIVNYGDSIKYVMKPNTGYKIDSVIVKDIYTPTATYVGRDTVYTFKNVTKDWGIFVKFDKAKYLISASSGPNGTIVPSGDTLIAHGDSIKYTITANFGYRIDSVVIDGVQQWGGADPKHTLTWHTFANVTAPHTIRATFKLLAPTITGFTPTTAAAGATVTITGTNFTGAMAVSFGGTAASSFSVVSATTITAIVANGATGKVSVTTPGGTAINNLEVSSNLVAPISTGWLNAWQKITTSAFNGTMYSVTFKLRNFNTTNNYNLFIELHKTDPSPSTPGKNFNSLLETSETVLIKNNTPASEVLFKFPGNYILDASTNYYVVIKEASNNPVGTEQHVYFDTVGANGGAGGHWGTLYYRFNYSPFFTFGYPKLEFASLQDRRLHFSGVKLGTSKDSVITIKNSGYDTLRISEVYIDSTFNTIAVLGEENSKGKTRTSDGIIPEFTVSPVTFKLAPGTSKEVTIKFTPNKIGIRKTRLIYEYKLSETTNTRDTLFASGYSFGSPVLTLNPKTHDFGSVKVNSQVFLKYELKNTGTDTMWMSEVFSTNPENFMARVPMGGLVLAPSHFYQDTILFWPKKVGSHAAHIKFRGKMVEDSIFVKGIATGAAKMRLSVNRIDFGSVKNSLFKDTMFTVYNDGDDMLRYKLRVDPPTMSSIFMVINNPQLERSVNPNGNMVEGIKLQPPTNLGQVMGILNFESNSVNKDSIQLVGNVVTRIQYGTEIPTTYSLSQNYPNPFNPVTTIRFGLPSEANVKLEIYNSIGQLVQVLLDEQLSAYYYEVKWETGKIPSGLYFYKITATDINNPNNKFVKTKKMVLTK